MDDSSRPPSSDKPFLSSWDPPTPLPSSPPNSLRFPSKSPLHDQVSFDNLTPLPPGFLSAHDGQVLR
ncbi:hypothetical protein BT69DRAFT_1283976, partial [Atractiella rhizophila]